MNEDKVYLQTKAWFLDKGFKPLAGQPPNGSDTIPVVEIKDPGNLVKGSKGSFKPDLVFANANYFVLIECKPSDDKEDEAKLLSVDSSSDRKEQLYCTVKQRRLLERRGLEPDFQTYDLFLAKLRYCLAHAGRPRQMERVSTLVLSRTLKECELVTSTNLQYAIEI